MKVWGENLILAMLLALDGTRQLLTQYLQLPAWRISNVKNKSYLLVLLLVNYLSLAADVA